MGVTHALTAVVDRLATVSWHWVFVALALHVTHHGLRAVAWHNVLRAADPERPAPLQTVAACYATGVALNAVTPARGGDAAKVALLRTRMPETPLATLASSMSVVLLFDTLAATLLVVLVCVLGLVPAAPPAPGGGLLVAAGALILAATALFVARRHLAPRAKAVLAAVRQGGAVLRTPRRYLREVALVQLTAWCCRLAVVACLLAAFGLPPSPALAALVLVFTGLSSLVPLTPGGAGGQQVLVAFALQGVASTSAAVSFSVGMQAGITVVNAVLGLAGAMVLVRTLRPWRAIRRCAYPGWGTPGARKATQASSVATRP